MLSKSEIHGVIKLCITETEFESLNHIHTITSLSAGLSNHNFLLEGDSKFVLRINSQQSSAICDRDNEIECWKAAEASGLAPNLLWVSTNRQYYLSEYCQPTSKNDVNVDGLHTLLTSLSRLAPPKKQLTTTKQWQIYRQQIEQLENRLFTDTTANVYSRWSVMKSAIWDKQKQINTWLNDIDSCVINPQYCHRDLSPDNILLKNNKLICIDFEYSCASNPLFELASVIVNFELNKGAAQELAHKYLTANPNVVANNYQQVTNAIAIFNIFYDCWVVLMAGNSLLANNDKIAIQQFEKYERLATKNG
ncbi:MAG: phosphotransferase [Parashewanella sp.]